MRDPETLTVSSVVIHLLSKADTGVCLSSFTPQKPPSSLSIWLKSFRFSSTVLARTSGPSNRSRSRRGTPGRPPAPCGWLADCRRGKPWRRRWTSRTTPSPPPAARRSWPGLSRQPGRSGTRPWPRSEAWCSIPTRTGSGRRRWCRRAAWSSGWWWWSRTRWWRRPEGKNIIQHVSEESEKDYRFI